MAMLAARPRPWVPHYDAGVPEEVDIPDLPLDGLLRQAAQRWPHAAAVGFYGRDTTFMALDRQVDRAAEPAGQPVFPTPPLPGSAAGRALMPTTREAAHGT
jgi:hypothetical protein